MSIALDGIGRTHKLSPSGEENEAQASGVAGSDGQPFLHLHVRRARFVYDMGSLHHACSWLDVGDRRGVLFRDRVW